MKKRKHLDENYDCASARLVRMVKCVKKSICDLGMSALTNGVRVCACNLIMCAQRAISVHETEAAGMWANMVVQVFTRSKLTPAPYEKAQTSEEKIYMQAVRSDVYTLRYPHLIYCTLSTQH